MENKKTQVCSNFTTHESEGAGAFRIIAHTCMSLGGIFYLLSCEVLEKEWHFVKFFQP